MKQKPGVYGTGTIGSEMATLTTGNGFPTIVIGHSESGCIRCKKAIEQNWNDLIQEGLASAENRKRALALLSITNNPESLSGCEVVFETVSEDIDIKASVYKAIESACGTETIIASCTSSLPAEILASHLRYPERFLIAHPFQPVHMLPLVEVVCHNNTGENILNQTLLLLQALHRQVVVLNKSVPGFLVNRFAQALFREAIYLIEQGVTTAKDIDQAIKYAVGMRYASIGLLEYFDAVGFELERAIALNVYPDLCTTCQIQKTVEQGIAMGKTGQLTGKGLYDWSTKDQNDFRRRKQSPYFGFVKEWDMP